MYLLVAIPATILLNLAFPNFHAPDDYDHVKRAYTLVHGPFGTITPEGRSTGALIDSGLAEYIDAQSPLVKSRRSLSREQRLASQRASNIGWTGKKVFSEMPGALNFLPVLYAPQTLMLEIGRLVGATIEMSVLWARLANAFAGIALATIGLYLLRGGEAIVLFLLLLPMTLLQFASNSADAVLYGLALIIVALGLRTAGSGRVRTIAIASAVFISGTVRPPMAALALTPGLQALRQRRWINLALLSTACAGASVWVLARLPSITDTRCGNLGSVELKLSAYAFEWPQLIGRTFVDRAAYYYVSFVGHYGWGDGRIGIIGSPMPIWIYLTALPLFMIAFCRDLFSRYQLRAALRISLTVSAFFSLWLTFLAMYVGCTVPGQTVIGGVQGRYFVTMLFAIAPALAGLLPRKDAQILDRLFPALLIAWSVACTATILVSAPYFTEVSTR
jgi:hypothetical protein